MTTAITGGTPRLHGYLEGPPVFCFTSDLEWAPEWAIREMYELADRYGIPITPFVTHRSPYLWARLRTAEEREDVGLHPNFLPGSTHGSTPAEVIETMTSLWPSAVSFRNHCQYEEARLHRFLARRFKYESNVCQFLQPLAMPQRTHTGLLRFPIFWEDDVHTDFGFAWHFEPFVAAFASPGLKVINVHPLRVALNVPDEAFYDSKRSFYKMDREAAVEWRSHVHSGAGSRTFLEDLMRWVTSTGQRVVRLSQLYREAVDNGLAPYRPDGAFHSPVLPPAETIGARARR